MDNDEDLTIDHEVIEAVGVHEVNEDETDEDVAANDTEEVPEAADVAVEDPLELDRKLTT